jgi:hypothetical protein
MNTKGRFFGTPIEDSALLFPVSGLYSVGWLYNHWESRGKVTGVA